VDQKIEAILERFSKYYDRTSADETFGELLEQHWYGVGLLTGSPRLNPFGLAHLHETGYGTLTVSGERSVLSDHSNMVARVAARVARGEEAAWPDSDSWQRKLDLWSNAYKPIRWYDRHHFPKTEPQTHLWPVGWNPNDETAFLIDLCQPTDAGDIFGWILTKEPQKSDPDQFVQLNVTRVCAYCQGALASDSCAWQHWGDIIENRKLNITFGL
jgi:hypothetical protein